jgi:hypothetical protein
MDNGRQVMAKADIATGILTVLTAVFRNTYNYVT